jgi:hypothetical protein
LAGTLVAALASRVPLRIVTCGAPLFHVAAKFLALLADDSIQNLTEARALDRLCRPSVWIVREPDGELAAPR